VEKKNIGSGIDKNDQLRSFYEQRSKENEMTWGGRKRFTDEERVKAFWGKVDKRGPDECWNWLGGKDRKGYGQFGVRGFTAKAHRVSWELLRSDIPKGLMVLHKCNNPSCVNPNHLHLGNNSDNMIDRTESGYSHKKAMADHGTLIGRTYIRDITKTSQPPDRKLSKKDIAQIHELLNTGLEQWIIAEMFEVSDSTISRVGGGCSRYKSRVGLNR